jgi:SM-20-related protein
MNALATELPPFDGNSDEPMFSRIADDLRQQGYSIQPLALPPKLAEALALEVHTLNHEAFERAGIGRSQSHVKNRFVRNDDICWINGSSEAGADWLKWTQALQTYLNRRLFLGLFSFESHYAYYRTGHFYKRHYDAFRGQANRVLTVVAYLNHDWQPDDGGELVVYRDDDDKEGIKVVPAMGSLVVFLSEEFPHEVLPAQRDRYSIAGWYRLNSSTNGQIDPPS